MTQNPDDQYQPLEFIEKLYGELPGYFKDEDNLRDIWSQPDTRKALLTSLSEKGFGQEQLSAIKKMIDAEKSDLFDVLAYIAFALPPITQARACRYQQTKYQFNLRRKTNSLPRLCPRPICRRRHQRIRFRQTPRSAQSKIRLHKRRCK